MRHLVLFELLGCFKILVTLLPVSWANRMKLVFGKMYAAYNVYAFGTWIVSDRSLAAKHKTARKMGV